MQWTGEGACDLGVYIHKLGFILEAIPRTKLVDLHVSREGGGVWAWRRKSRRGACECANNSTHGGWPHQRGLEDGGAEAGQASAFRAAICLPALPLFALSSLFVLILP